LIGGPIMGGQANMGEFMDPNMDPDIQKLSGCL